MYSLCKHDGHNVHGRGQRSVGYLEQMFSHQFSKWIRESQRRRVAHLFQKIRATRTRHENQRRRRVGLQLSENRFASKL